MKSCFASLVQAAANSFVAVIGSMTRFYRSRGALSRIVEGSHIGTGARFSDITIRLRVVGYLLVIKRFIALPEQPERQGHRNHESSFHPRVWRARGHQIRRSPGPI